MAGCNATECNTLMAAFGHNSRHSAEVSVLHAQPCSLQCFTQQSYIYRHTAAKYCADVRFCCTQRPVDTAEQHWHSALLHLIQQTKGVQSSLPGFLTALAATSSSTCIMRAKTTCSALSKGPRCCMEAKTTPCNTTQPAISQDGQNAPGSLS